MLGRVEGKPWDIIWFDRIANKTAGGVAVKSEHEEKCEVMGIPERLEALVADFVVRSCIHEEHDQQHEVASDATGLFIVNVECGDGTDLYIGDQREVKVGVC